MNGGRGRGRTTEHRGQTDLRSSTIIDRSLKAVIDPERPFLARLPADAGIETTVPAVARELVLAVGDETGSRAGNRPVELCLGIVNRWAGCNGKCRSDSPGDHRI